MWRRVKSASHASHSDDATTPPPNLRRRLYCTQLSTTITSRLPNKEKAICYFFSLKNKMEKQSLRMSANSYPRQEGH